MARVEQFPPAIRNLIEVLPNRSDSEIQDLLSKAIALLHPSFAEGYGLVVAEALAASVPVLCSDLPELREVGRDSAIYVDPSDENGWFDAINSELGKRYSGDIPGKRNSGWRTPTWDEHFAKIGSIFRDFMHDQIMTEWFGAEEK